MIEILCAMTASCNVVQQCDRTNVDVLGLRGLKDECYILVFTQVRSFKRSAKLSHLTLGVQCLVVCLILEFNCSNKSRIWKNIKQTQVHRANLEQHFLALGRGIRYLWRNWVRHHSIKIQKTLFGYERSAKSYVFKKMIWIKPTFVFKEKICYIYILQYNNYFTIKFVLNRPQRPPDGPSWKSVAQELNFRIDFIPFFAYF